MIMRMVRKTWNNKKTFWHLRLSIIMDWLGWFSRSNKISSYMKIEINIYRDILRERMRILII